MHTWCSLLTFPASSLITLLFFSHPLPQRLVCYRIIRRGDSLLPSCYLRYSDSTGVWLGLKSTFMMLSQGMLRVYRGQQTFFVKGSDGKYFGLCSLFGLCLNYSALPTQLCLCSVKAAKDNTEWEWLYSTKTLFTKTDGKLDRLCTANHEL